MKATWLADVLRDAGLEVEEEPGSKTRGLEFIVPLDGTVWHHDASAPGPSAFVPQYMARQIDSGKAGAQLWVSTTGVWHIVACGKVGHAGKTLPGKLHNGNSLGIETDHTTGEKWPDVQVQSLRRGTAAILFKLEASPAMGLDFHRTIAAPLGRKSDPDGLFLAPERAAVAGLMAAKTAATHKEDDMALTDDDVKRIARAVHALTNKDVVTILRATDQPSIKKLDGRLDRIEKQLGIEEAS